VLVDRSSRLGRAARDLSAELVLQIVLHLAAAQLRHVAGTERSTKRYLSMELLMDHTQETVTA